MSASVRLDVSSESMYDAWTRMKITMAALENTSSRAHQWVDAVEAGEYDADQMFSEIRILTDQLDQLHDYLTMAQELVDEQSHALRRALGW